MGRKDNIAGDGRRELQNGITTLFLIYMGAAYPLIMHDKYFDITVTKYRAFYIALCIYAVLMVLAVLVAVLLDAALSLVVGNLPGVQLPPSIPAILGPLTMVWYIIAEFGSIIENIGLMGVPVPGFLQKAIKVLNNAVDAAGDAASGGEENSEE